ncbi:MAG TPA: hypothetical protein PKL61_13780, partial [Accumulibacter sp.]|uniref:hypothetical protein n=1 Tax=Accumulibacter sp. TaxID=2053492 RepID=UPI002BEB57FD
CAAEARATAVSQRCRKHTDDLRRAGTAHRNLDLAAVRREGDRVILSAATRNWLKAAGYILDASHFHLRRKKSSTYSVCYASEVSCAADLSPRLQRMFQGAEKNTKEAPKSEERASLPNLHSRRKSSFASSGLNQFQNGRDISSRFASESPTESDALR